MNIGELVILRQGDKYIIVFNFEMSKNCTSNILDCILGPLPQLKKKKSHLAQSEF